VSGCKSRWSRWNITTLFNRVFNPGLEHCPQQMRALLCLATLLLAGAEVAKFHAAPRSDLVAPNWLGHHKMYIPAAGGLDCSHAVESHSQPHSTVGCEIRSRTLLVGALAGRAPDHQNPTHG
jgi:hypothetical protein